ncbi:MAG TPA: hypothetical protein VGA13_12630 [Acidimicrobiales bacterium]
MRVSEHFGLNRNQPSLEFVDVDISGDIHVYVDPRAVRSIGSDWSDECVSLLQSFFDTVLQAMRAGNDDPARQLLASLREPNETHLGLSRGRAQGRGMGDSLARDVWTSVSRSRAVNSGLIEDLEDTVLFVEGIGFDIISDITTNIIRGPLIEFTHDVAGYYGIPLTGGVASGQIWDRRTRRWTQGFTQLPTTAHGPLILVPKSIVRQNQTFDPGEYFNHFVLPQMQTDELRAHSSLVQVLRDGERRVTKKSLKERYGQGKRVSLDTTLKHPDLLDRYRQAKSGRLRAPSHEEIAEVTESDLPDWDGLLTTVTDVQVGAATATDYHRSVEALLTALFYPALDRPLREFEIHEGRKRIDITYTNIASRGFFDWVNRVQGAPAPNVFVECKNYGSELANPEVDQIAGRFSPLRGRLGLLVHRGFGDKDRLLRRCRDTALDDRGFILPLDDDDLRALVDERKSNPDSRTPDIAA